MPTSLKKGFAIHPAFSETENAIVFATDNNYAPYCAVALASLIDKASATKQYDIVILYEELSEKNRERLLRIVGSTKSVSLRFYNMHDFVENYRKTFFVRSNFTIAAYYRLFIVEIFTHYKKVAYIDCDTLFVDEISELFLLEMHNKLAGAVIDDFLTQNSQFMHYVKEELQLLSPEHYINSGMILFNITALKSFDLLTKCLDFFKKHPSPVHQDQDVLNTVLYEKILHLPKEWNYFSTPKRLDPTKPKDNPKIIHFIGAKKPWEALQSLYSAKFWEYAKATPYYTELLENILKLLPKRLQFIKKKYLLYSFLNLLPAITPLAATKRKAAERKWVYGTEIKATKAFLHEHRR